MRRIARKLRLFIANIKWYCGRNSRILIGNPAPLFSVETYKPSFVAKHTPEEMEKLRLQEAKELIEEIEEMIYSNK